MSCKIEFQSDVIYSGQLLRGTVQLTLESDKKVRDFFIRISGKTYASQSVEATLLRVSKKKSHLNTKICLAHENNAELQLSAGTHHYPFELLLPSNLPSSIEGVFGYTRYKACVIVVNSSVSKNKFTKKFSVVNVVDLNATPSLRESLIVERNVSIAVGYLPCFYTSDAVEIKAKIPITGYLPHQTINLEIIVNNETNKTIKKFNVELIKRVTFFVKHRFTIERKSECETALSFIETKGCECNHEERIRVDMPIPDTQPTDLINKIIKIEYFLKISGVVDIGFNNVILLLPITVGSKGFMEH